jgi:hypothetical protein
MNCHRCNKPALVLFPGGYCGKCNSELIAPKIQAAPKRTRKVAIRKGTPGRYQPTEACQQCGEIKDAKSGECKAQYLRRRYCAAPRTCYADAQRDRAMGHKPWRGNKKTVCQPAADVVAGQASNEGSN